VKITRRELALGAGALVLTGAFGGLSALGLDLIGPAAAQDPSPADLAQPGPLGDMVLGDEKAPITIIEYASMTCPHCAHFHETTYPELKKRYIDTGKVRFIMREFPLDPLAAAGFMLARCSAQEPAKGANPVSASDAAIISAQRYHAMVETLFSQQHDWVVQRPLQPLLAIAKQAGFTQQSFESCLNDRKLQGDIETVRNTASEKLGVNSTPTFFINGKKVAGAMTIEDLDKMLAPYLKT
jgi:protein-disulfide isomerase